MAGKKKIRIWLIFATVSVCLLAGLGGYKGARYIAYRITSEAEKNAEKAGLFKPQGVEESLTEQIINGTTDIKTSKLRPLTLLYLVDYETGKVQKLALEVFDTVSMTASFIYLDPDISYTMTGSLYRALANGNVLVPQTVTFSELYSYYGTYAAFDAGKKIAGELLGTPIDYYAAFTVEEGGDELKIQRFTSLGVKTLYETLGRLTLSNAKDLLGSGNYGLTDMTADECEGYGNLTGYLKDKDIFVYEAPVIKHNESCFVDIAGTWEILGALIDK